jgi:hypothetical protein
VRLEVPDLCGWIWRRPSRFGSPDRLRRVQRRYLGTSRGKRLRGLVSAGWKRLADLADTAPGSGGPQSPACSFGPFKALEPLVYRGGRLGVDRLNRAMDTCARPSPEVRVWVCDRTECFYASVDLD